MTDATLAAVMPLSAKAPAFRKASAFPAPTAWKSDLDLTGDEAFDFMEEFLTHFGIERGDSCVPALLLRRGL